MILTHDGIILASAGGQIIDDAGTNPGCCCGCPPCYIPKVAGQVCECIPTRFLAVGTGLTTCDGCFIADCGGFPPHEHVEIHNQDFSGAYCFPGASVIGMVDGTAWGNDSPTDNCLGASLIGSGADVTITLGVAFGVAGVEVEATVVGHMAGIGIDFTIFHRHVLHQNCSGPWVLTNDVGGCNFACPPFFAANPSAIIIVYPCAC